MAFKKGDPKPANSGKQKGTLNKSTSEVREAIAIFASANVEKMGEWLNAIDSPEKKLDLYLKAIEYHIPKLARHTHVGDADEPLKAEISVIERVIKTPDEAKS